MSLRRQRVFAALSGIGAAIVALGIAEVLALLVAPSSSPLFAVGSFVIDIVPPWVKETAIALFGTGDKAALLVGLGILVAVLAAIVGWLQLARPPFGLVGLSLVGLVALAAVVSRTGATLMSPVPTIVGMVVGAVLLRALIERLRDWKASTDAKPRNIGYARRSFLGLLGATAGAALIAGLAARAVNATTSAVNTARDALTLPKPATPAAPVPAGAQLDIPGMYPLVTPNADYYRIDTALQVPVVDVSTWRLKITGMVEHEVEIGFDELAALPLIETYVTLACVSNDIGGGLIGNAKWLGYPIRDLLARAKPLAGADMVLSTSVDGFTAGSPLEVLQDENRDAIFAIGMNDEPLPLEHGFPVRMVVPGLYGYVSATKWVTELRVTRFADDQGYWTPRGWSALGPVKLNSRIDTPKYTAAFEAGPTVIAGVAWSQHVGVSAVEIRVDKKTWVPATLAPAISADTWVQWSVPWDAQPGIHIIEVRATDANGFVQPGDYKSVAPDGAEGWHAITVDVG
jgi:DMSO/TMAO reductase YedYZ molybdopterin-dependent catalytic subunit